MTVDSPTKNVYPPYPEGEGLFNRGKENELKNSYKMRAFDFEELPKIDNDLINLRFELIQQFRPSSHIQRRPVLDVIKESTDNQNYGEYKSPMEIIDAKRERLKKGAAGHGG